MKHSDQVSGKLVLLRRLSAFVCLFALLISMGVPAFVHASAAHEASQEIAAKRPLTHQDYDSWRSIQAPQISRDGRFVAYAFMPQDGDAEIVVRNIASGSEWRAPRGYRPPVPPPDDPGANVAEFQAAQGRLLRPVFTADSRFLVFGTEPNKADITKAKKEKKKHPNLFKKQIS